MVKCFVHGCEHETMISECLFIQYPSKGLLREMWKVYLGRYNTPTSHSKVCECHFEENAICPTININNYDTNSFNLEDKNALLMSENQILRSMLGSLENSVFPQIDEMSELFVQRETGINRSDFSSILTSLADYSYPFRTVRSIYVHPADRLFITLMMFRGAYTPEHIGALYKLESETILDIVIGTLEALFCRLQEVLGVSSLMTFYKVKPISIMNLPKIDMILDCLELDIEDNPKRNNYMNDDTFIMEKKTTKVKYLIGISNIGLVIFMSNISLWKKSTKRIASDELISNWKTIDLVTLKNDIIDPHQLSKQSTVNFVPVDRYGKGGEKENHSDKLKCCEKPMRQTTQLLYEFSILKCIPWVLSAYSAKILRVCSLLVNIKVPRMMRTEDYVKRNIQHINNIRQHCIKEHIANISSTDK